MTSHRSRLEDLAARIDDGLPIDWERETRQAEDAETRGLIEGLKTLSDVADLLKHPERIPETAVEPAGTSWGDLEVFEVVGRGAFGTVHRARERQLDRIVALKLLDPGVDATHLKTRILEEGRLLARLQHPNIVNVYGTGESDGRVGLWMEFIDGWTLGAEVDAHGPMSAEESANIGRKLCGTLVTIHAEGFVHADLKAHNVMRQRGGRIVLMDFGAGQPLVDADARRLAGTPLYLSPERLAGGPSSTSCDIYALGVLLYFLATGAHPVDGETRDDVERAHRDGRYVRLRDRRPDLPDAFVAAVEDAIAPDPARRHATAGALDAALARVIVPDAAPSSGPAAIVTLLSDGTKGSGNAPPGPARWSRWTVPAVAAAVLTASVLGIGWAIMRPPPPGPSAVARSSPAAPPVATEYSVQAAFYQVDEKSRQVKLSGARITEGDTLELDLRLSQSASVYVINEDERGSVWLLFPLPDATLRNPLRGGQAYTLPGPDATKPVQWLIDEYGGREHFYVIVSPAVDPTLQAAIDRLTPASDHSSPSLNARVELQPGGLRGASKLAHVVTKLPDRDAPWRALAKPLSATEERGRGLWVRELTLQKTPAPR
ncbi:MAG: protein kinase [Vicinamibacteraceae bacterium]